MKILTVLGTRPEIIRLSLVIPALDASCDHRLVHTGQNYAPELSDVFFRDLRVREPDLHLGIRSSDFAEQAGQVLTRIGEVLERERPDRVLILGDTNSGLAAIVAARRQIPVFHMEAGNRCYDDRVPEEVNRRVIDHSSTILLPYTRRSMENLVNEGIERERIYVTGNPIFEVLEAHRERIASTDVMTRLDVRPAGFFLVTLHRAENVDEPAKFAELLRALTMVTDEFRLPVLVSTHPRTRARLEAADLKDRARSLRLLDPLPFFDFVHLERKARAVLSDSGTVQEECAIFRVPNVTLRDVTERPETVECGSNILGGTSADDILRAVRLVLSRQPNWNPPPEYLVPNVANTVTNILLGHLDVRRYGVKR